MSHGVLLGLPPLLRLFETLELLLHILIDRDELLNLLLLLSHLLFDCIAFRGIRWGGRLGRKGAG